MSSKRTKWLLKRVVGSVLYTPASFPFTIVTVPSWMCGSIFPTGPWRQQPWRSSTHRLRSVWMWAGACCWPTASPHGPSATEGKWKASWTQMLLVPATQTRVLLVLEGDGTRPTASLIPRRSCVPPPFAPCTSSLIQSASKSLEDVSL